MRGTREWGRMEQGTAAFNISLVILFDCFLIMKNIMEYIPFKKLPTTHHPIFDVYKMYIVSIKKSKLNLKD